MSKTRGWWKSSLRGGVVVGLVLAGLMAERAAAADGDLALVDSAAFVISKDINGFPAQTKVVATENFPEYSLSPVVDGIKARKDLYWQVNSWASAEDSSPHGIEVQLSKPRTGGRFQVTWAYDIFNAENGHWWISRDYLIQIKNKAEDRWKTVVDVKGNQSVIGNYPLPYEAFNFIRIYQPAGGGDPARPNIMWVGQIELVD